MGVPSYRFPELVDCRVRGSAVHVGESFWRSQQQELGDEYAGHEGEWRAFKAKLSSRTVGPRTRAVAAKRHYEPDKPHSELPPLLARHLASRQRDPWRQKCLQSELKYNELSGGRLPGAQPAQPGGPHHHQQQQHGNFSGATFFRRPVPPNVLPPDEAFEMLHDDVAQARRRRVTAPVWLHGKAYPVDDTLSAGGAHRGGHALSARR